MKLNSRVKSLSGSAIVACATVFLASCETLGPQIDKNPLVLPASPARSEAETVPLEQPARFESKSKITEPELYKARSGRIGKAPTPARPVPEGGFVLNFDDADLGEVAKVILGDSLKKNYVISPKVTGKATLRTVKPLEEKELLPTLEMVLRMNGAVLIEDQGGYRIEPDTDAARHGALGRSGYRLQVVPLRYVAAQDMQTVLQPILPPNAIIKMDTARNLLFLSGSSEDIERVVEVVQVFDVNYLQGMSFALYPLKNVAVNTIFGEMQAMFGEGSAGPLAGTIRLLPIERLNAVMAITAQPAYLEELRTWVERLDRSNSAGGGNMHVYRAQHVDAMQLAATLGQVLGTGGGGFGMGAGLAPGLRPTTLSGGVGGGLGGGFGSSGGMSGGGLGGGSTTGASGLSGSSTGRSTSGTTGGTGTGSSTSGGLGSGGTGGIGGGLGGGMAGAGVGGVAGGAGAAGGGLGGFGGFGGGTGMGGAGGTGENAVRVTPDIANNALVIVAPPFEYQAIEKLLRELDVMPLQVLIDATIVEVVLDDTLKYGLAWLFKHGGGEAAFGAVTDAAKLAGAGGFAYSFIAKNVEVTLDALAKIEKVNVLSSPSLMVLNNQQAIIKVGDQVPIRTSESTPTTGGTTSASTTTLIATSTIQMRDTGVQLTIRPRVNKGGLVTMDVQQQVDDVTNTTSSKIDSPTIQQRQILSSVAVKSDDTIVLGGLIKEKRDKSVNGLPWLSTLPVIGPLFGTNNRELHRTELVVLITPHVVEDRNTMLSVTEEYKRRMKGLQPAGNADAIP